MHTIAVFKIYACICIVYFKDAYNRREMKLSTCIVYLISSKIYMIIYKKQILKLKRLN